MRIASLSPAVTEILFRLGVEDQIICRDQFSTFPEAAKDIPAVKDMVNIDPFEVHDFQPDLILLGTSIQKKLEQEFTQRGFSVMFNDPRTIADIYDWIRSFGTMFEKEQAANALVLEMQQVFNDVKKKGGLLPKKPKVYIEEWPACASGEASAGRPSLPYASGNWVPELARLAGGQPYPVPDGELSPEVTLQQVEQFDPDMIVLSWCGAGDVVDAAQFTQREGWEHLRAIQEGNVRVIDDSLLNRPGPRLVEGAQRLYGWMFELLH